MPTNDSECACSSLACSRSFICRQIGRLMITLGVVERIKKDPCLEVKTVDDVIREIHSELEILHK